MSSKCFTRRVALFIVKQKSSQSPSRQSKVQLQVISQRLDWSDSIIERTIGLELSLDNLLPAEKGGLRRADVSKSVCLFVCLSVCCCIDFPLNFTMVMGSFTQKHVLIQTDQSESWKGCMGPFRLTNQGAGYVADQSEFLIISPCKGITDDSHLLICQLSV